ncbi:MAG: hypothetical protein QXT45_07760 [Candidatus Bilamarchaeaceae archaeon]
MYKLIIKLKDSQEEKANVVFSSLEELNNWVDFCDANNIWNLKDRIETVPAKKELQEVEIQPEIRDEDGNIIQERIVELQEVEIEPEQTIVHTATHTYEIVDITEELNKQQALERRQRLRLAGERLIDEMSIKNTELGLDLAQLKTIMLDTDAALVRELLWTGSLESAKAVIEEKREKFEQMMSIEYVEWVLERIDQLNAN